MISPSCNESAQTWRYNASPDRKRVALLDKSTNMATPTKRKCTAIDLEALKAEGKKSLTSAEVVIDKSIEEHRMPAALWVSKEISPIAGRKRAREVTDEYHDRKSSSVNEQLKEESARYVLEGRVKQREAEMAMTAAEKVLAVAKDVLAAAAKDARIREEQPMLDWAKPSEKLGEGEHNEDGMEESGGAGSEIQIEEDIDAVQVTGMKENGTAANLTKMSSFNASQGGPLELEEQFEIQEEMSQSLVDKLVSQLCSKIPVLAYRTCACGTETISLAHHKDWSTRQCMALHLFASSQ